MHQRRRRREQQQQQWQQLVHPPQPARPPCIRCHPPKVLLEDAVDACLQDDAVVDGHQAHLQGSTQAASQAAEGQLRRRELGQAVPNPQSLHWGSPARPTPVHPPCPRSHVWLAVPAGLAAPRDAAVHHVVRHQEVGLRRLEGHRAQLISAASRAAMLLLVCLVVNGCMLPSTQHPGHCQPTSCPKGDGASLSHL